MKDRIASETPCEFISRLQKSVLEAPDGAAAVAALPQIFERDLTLVLNGQRLDWAWVEQHVQEVHLPLREVAVNVTHAVRDDDVLMERHTVAGIAQDTKAPWQMEVMAVYEFSPEQKIRSWYEITQIRAGEYVGGW